jgi:hypothetical protein
MYPPKNSANLGVTGYSLPPAFAFGVETLLFMASTCSFLIDRISVNRIAVPSPIKMKFKPSLWHECPCWF